jgi:hypothetical protein
MHGGLSTGAPWGNLNAATHGDTIFEARQWRRLIARHWREGRAFIAAALCEHKAQMGAAKAALRAKRAAAAPRRHVGRAGGIG